MLTKFLRFKRKKSKSKGDECTENNIQFIVSRCNSSKVFQVVKQPLNLIPPLVYLLVIFPWSFHRTFRRYHRNSMYLSDHSPCLFVCISFIHCHFCSSSQNQRSQQSSPFRSIMIVSRAQRKRNGFMCPRRNQMYFGR